LRFHCWRAGSMIEQRALHDLLENLANQRTAHLWWPKIK